MRVKVYKGPFEYILYAYVDPLAAFSQYQAANDPEYIVIFRAEISFGSRQLITVVPAR